MGRPDGHVEGEGGLPAPARRGLPQFFWKPWAAHITLPAPAPAGHIAVADRATRGDVLLRAISLALSLFVVWLLLSGHLEPLLLGLGAASCIAVVLIARRMDVIDREGHPIHLGWKAPFYWLWLAWEVIKANLDVARRIVAPSLPISPTVIRVKTSQKTELGRVIYANSITLTPGTISLAVRRDEIEVHALSREAAAALAEGTMDRRVTQMEGAG